MHVRKNSDYSQVSDSLSNFRMCESFGAEAWRGCLVRVSDKWARVQSLAAKEVHGEAPAVLEEALNDTLMDLAAYALLVRILREEAEKDRMAEENMEAKPR